MEIYKNSFTYDANGNISNQQKHDQSGVQFENLNYQYFDETTGGRLLKNRLYHVNDNVAYNGLQPDDIDDQGTFNYNPTNNSTLPMDYSTINTSNNYRYDEIGNLIKDVKEEIASIKWTVYGKIDSLVRIGTSTKSDLKFLYDAGGNRIAKIEKTKTSTGALNPMPFWKTTYYVRDAQGNVMATYKSTTPIPTGGGTPTLTFKLTERDIYGSSRLGLDNNEIEFIGSSGIDLTQAQRILGKKQYELANHLGNVLTVITDRKIPVDVNADNITDYYLADVVSATDYYPFGSPMPTRKYQSSSPYRYGMNGQENDNEIFEGATTAEYWEYDSRLGRRWNIDPVVKVHESPYVCFANNPVWIIDKNGADSTLYNSTTGAFVAKGITPQDDKTAIWTVDPTEKGYNSKNPWETATKLLYNVGSSDDKKDGKAAGITGDSFRTDHPLFSKRKSVTGNFAMEFGTQVYEEDLFNTTKIFIDVLAKGNDNFTPTKMGPWKIWFYTQVTDDGPYDLKSTKRTNTGTIPCFAAIIMGEWTICAGRLTRYDDYGNISFGYWGKLYGFSADYLLEKADDNQNTKNGKTTIGVGDEPRDKEAIKLGIKLYRK